MRLPSGLSSSSGGILTVGLSLLTLASTAPANTTVDHDYTVNPGSDWVSFAPSGASAGFKCYYPYLSNREWEDCNDQTRGCWIRKKDSKGGNYKRGRLGYDIHTDYDDYAPVGVRRYYTYNVVTKTIAPDGIPKEALLFDGIYPGPLLEACWGDEILVTIVNNLPDQGTTIHWHGIRQLFTNDMDGVALTQCPIARGESFTYRFRVTQYGPSWYHSHYSLQYADGLAAPMIIHGPSSANFDITVPEPIFIADWVDGSIAHAYEDEKNPQVRGASTDSILVNGIGTVTPVGVARKFRNDIRSAYHVIKIMPEKKNRIWVINASVATAYVFSIDGHSFTVIGNDFVPVKPYTTNSIVVAIGQRYEIIIDALEKPNASGNYWIRTQPADGCNRFRRGFFNSQANPPSIPFDVRTAVLHYEAPHTSYYILPTTQSAVTSFDCSDLHVQGALEPIVPWLVKKPVNSLTKSTFYAAHQTANDKGLGQLGDYAHWLLRLDPVAEKKTGMRMHHPFWAEFSQPTLLNLYAAHKDPYHNVINYSSKDRDGFIYMVIDGALLPTTSPADVNGSFIIPRVAHPMHWHGSDVVIIGQDTKPFDPVTSPKTWRFNNPPRRDTVTMPSGGYVAIAFKPDNPGVWLVHCHIAWHASAGLALQMIIQDEPGHIYRMLGQKALNTVRDGCRSWNRDLFRRDRQPMLHKDDSGI